MFVCPFPTDPKFWKTWLLFFPLIFNFAFLNKIVEMVIFKMHWKLPQKLTVLAQVYLFTPYMSPPDPLMSLRPKKKIVILA